LLEAHPRCAELASATLKLVDEGVIAGLTSTLAIAELLTAPAQANDDSALRDYELYLTHFPHLTILPLPIANARRADRVQARTKLKRPDAIQIATAMEAGADVIIGNDKRWRGRTDSLPLLLLDDFLEVESP